MWKLVIEDDEGKRTVVPLTRDDYSIGRKEGNTIRLTERNVSREHARLKRQNHSSPNNGANGADKGAYLLEDLTSYNGVYVNGLRVAHAQELAHGDLIQIGDYRIILQDDAVAEAGAGAATSALSPDAKQTLPTAGQGRASLLMERPNRLVMLAGPTPGAEYPLDRERLTLGRAEDANISINHNSVSRLHCEVHALGDGRFEIVDKGSSNGVRVNSAELRRGIIEAGDVIELGDVKFKFVAAGQIFRPGATDSQQLSAIGERAAAQIVGSRRSATALPFVVFGAVVAVGAIAAWFFTRPKPDVPPTATSAPATVVNPEASALAEAKKLCAAGDCDLAHEKINNEIGPDSPLRNDPDFKGIETKWADAVLVRAENEQDVQKRRGMLDRVAKAMTVDSGRRKIAADKLQELDGFSTTNPQQLPLAKDAGKDHEHDAGHFVYDAGFKPPVWDAGVAAPNTASAPTASTTKPPATNPSDFDKEGQLAIQKADLARRSLEGKVWSGRASRDETRLLIELCKEAGDKGCVARARQMLDKPQQ